MSKEDARFWLYALCSIALVVGFMVGGIFYAFFVVAAEQSMHLTAFGVGGLAFLAGVVVSWLLFYCKFGGR